MRRIRLATGLAISVAFLSGAVWATGVPAQEEGEAAIAAARASADPVAALGALIRGYEAELADLQDALRESNIQRGQLESHLAERRDQIRAVLIALEGAGAPPGDFPMPHPGGPLAGARAAQVLAGIVPALRDEIKLFEHDRDRLASLMANQQEAIGAIAAMLGEAEIARGDLTSAVYERQDRDLERGAISSGNNKLTELAVAATDFGEIIAALPKRPEAPAGAMPANLPLPVAGELQRGFNEPEPSGQTRPGITLATQPMALVTAPVRAVVRYAGPVRRGRAVVLEPVRGQFIILSGLNRLYVTEGETLGPGAPIGLMGGHARAPDTFAPATAEPAGAPVPERLYMEARDSTTAVDPMRWFAVRKD